MKRMNGFARELAFAATLLICSAAYATPHELTPGSSGDDTVQLQEAFSKCTNPHKPCDLRLGAGIFYTDVLLVKGFNGAITGRGQGRTIIRPLATRALRSAPLPFSEEPTLAQPYPVLLHFANGAKVSLSKLTLEFPADMTVMPYDFYLAGPDGIGVNNSLLAAVMVDGTRNAELLMKQVTIVGSGNDTYFASNLSAAVRFEGQLRPTGEVDRTRKLERGRIIAYDNDFRRTGDGFSIEDVNNMEGLIVNNKIDARIYAVIFTNLGASNVAAVRNHIRAELTGIFVAQTPQRPPAIPSRYLIAQNTISVNENDNSVDVTGKGYEGIAVFDFAAQEPPVIGETIEADVNIVGNDITVGPDLAIDGITVVSDGPGDVRVLGNRIRGGPTDSGIFVDLSQGTFIAGNDLRAIDPPLGDVHLFPDSRECRVIERNDTVLDEGTDNIVSAGSIPVTVSSATSDQALSAAPAAETRQSRTRQFSRRPR